MTLIVRRATINDIGYLAEMNKQLIEDEKSRNPMNVQQLQVRMQTWIDSDWSAVMIYKNDDLIGYLLYQQRRDEFEPMERVIYIRQFFVQRASRRRGFGRQAFDLIVSEYFPSDARIMLDVLASNPEALRFWEELGFATYATTLHRHAIKDAPA